MDVRLEYHQPDDVWAAVFLRDGEPWYLDGALVGIHDTPWSSVENLIDLARHLVIEGENFLTNGPVSMEHREWLFEVLDRPPLNQDEIGENGMYLAMRTAGYKG